MRTSHWRAWMGAAVVAAWLPGCGSEDATEDDGVAGAGSGTCLAGELQCNGVCIDFNNDSANCGACGAVCRPGSSCVAGVCTCLSGLTGCNGDCVDLMNDVANCGTCAVACAAGEACVTGLCVAGGIGGATGAGGAGTGGSGVGGSGVGGLGTGGAGVGGSGVGGLGTGGAGTGGAGTGGSGTGGLGTGGDGTGGDGTGGDGTGGDGTGGLTSSTCGVNSDLGTGVVQMEDLCRGVVAVSSGGGNFVSWRLLGYEPPDIAFNVYRDGTLVNSSPITTSTNYMDNGASSNATYTVRAVIGGVEQGDSSQSRTDTSPTPTWGQNYQTISLSTTPEYRAGDTAPGDLDGDGVYELVVKEEQSPRDPSQEGVTGQPKFAAYELDGTFLWRVDLGINIRESEHTTPFVVYDLDGDGSAELAVKTAPGTRDGTGTYLSDGPAANDDDSADYRNAEGRILGGPEYLTIFSGIDGSEFATIAYHAPIDSGNWGDNYGNRSDRYNASVAFLDDTGRPSVVHQRGYYERTTFGAYNYRDGQLTLAWDFDSSDSGNSAYGGKGCHTLMVADGNGDNRQEIIPGAATIGPDGTGVCAVSFYGHGDALHITDLVPSRPGLEVFQPTEAEGVPSYFVRDLMTCDIVWQSGNSSGEGPGRGAADDISPNNPGGEAWVNSAGLFSATDGSNVGSNPSSCNFLIWWDGDESRELLNGNTVSEYDGDGQGFSASGCSSINGTKSVPNLSADLFGDWREEVIFSCGEDLRVYTTTQLTTRRIYTLMHDPQYRANVSSQNASYNQPPHTSFHIGDGMATPPLPTIHVR